MATEKNKKAYNSILIILISILVWLYLAKYVGWLMDILGGYEHEGESPNGSASIIVFLHVLPAFIIQLLNCRYWKRCHKSKEIFLGGLTGLFVIGTLLYVIFELIFSIGGAYFLVMFSVVGVPLLFLLSIGYLVFRLIKTIIKLLKKKKDENN